jgi:hypothetical protein
MISLSKPSIVQHRICFRITRLATGWTIRGSYYGGGEIFRTRPDRPWGPPSHLYNGYRVFPGVERPGRGADHPSLRAPTSRKSKAIPLALRSRKSTAIPLAPRSRKNTAIPLAVRSRKSTAIPLAPRSRKNRTIPLAPRSRKSTAIPLAQRSRKSRAIPLAQRSRVE